jgi:UDP:flavonoid glycosyltransferase YjiC (YdhE family)
MMPTMGLNIVVAMHHEEGHCNGSFGLAKRLRDRGHKVIYLGLMDARKVVIEQGFEFVPLAEEILPEGALLESTEPLTGSLPDPRRYWRRRVASERLFARFVRTFSNGHLDQRLLSAKADVLLCDTCVWYVGLRATMLGIPTVNIATSFASHPNPYIPPFVCARVPQPTWWGRMKVRADWLWLRGRFVFTKRLASILLGRFRSPSRMHHLTGEFLRLAKRSRTASNSRFASKENRSYRFTEIGPRMVLPEIVLPPRSFDFPHPPGVDRVYLGDFVDLRRKEDATLLKELDPEKPLVYCSLGSVSRYYPHSGHLFRTVAAASRQRKDWQWVLSVGTGQDVDGFGDQGSNLLVVKWAPQLSLLQRAAVMVTHGGINSIMECIHFTVPMVIVPGLRDQPGNMARALHHRIAVTGSMKDITAVELVKLIENAMHNAGLRQALSEMKDRIAAEAGMEAAVELIEAAGRIGPSDGSRYRRNAGLALETTQPLNLSPK